MLLLNLQHVINADARFSPIVTQGCLSVVAELHRRKAVLTAVYLQAGNGVELMYKNNRLHK